MQRVTRFRTNEEGVIGILVAILMASVLIAIGALAIDVGSLYAERRELQNGADFAALTVANDCAVAASCPGSIATTAQTYADANANDNNTAVDDICGTAPGLNGCSAKQGAWDCDPPIGSANYVQVRTSTKRPGGGTLMPPILAKTLAGNGSDPGRTVRACARAAYGGVASATTMAMTVSLCEWNIATSNGTVFAPKPPYPPNPAASFERILMLHTTSGISTCGGGPSGWDLPGGFGWLDDTGTPPNCSTSVDAGGIYNDNTGVPASGACKTALANAQSGQYTIYMPVYDGAGGTGHNGTYHLAGFAAFIVTGYQLPGLNKKSWLTDINDCGTGSPPSSKCLLGFFTQGLVPAGDIGTSTLPGVITTELSG